MEVTLSRFIFFICLIFFALSHSFGMFMTESYDVGTIYRVSDSDQGLNGYIRLRVSSYFPLEVPTTYPGEDDQEYFLKQNEEKITKCRNRIVLTANLRSWLGDIDFQKVSPIFRGVLQKHIPSLNAYGLSSSEAEKLSIVVSRNLSWSEGIALVRKVYGEGDGNHINIRTLEDSLFLIFLHIASPGFSDYPFSFFSKEKRERRSNDERFFNNCMERAITKYMEEVDKYTGLDPLGECERRYCSDSDKKKQD